MRLKHKNDVRKKPYREDKLGERQIFDFKVFINKDFQKEDAITES